MKELKHIAQHLATLGEYVREARGALSPDLVRTKDHANDLLTEVDLTVQQRFWEATQNRFPGDVLFGEEAGYSDYPEDPKGRIWICDPIDGTQNFVRSLFPTFGISVAFAEGGKGDRTTLPTQ